jgi:hypothetical protein
MAVPPYWNTGFKKTQIAAFTDVADWIVGIRTMLTATLDVADRWVESPANTFTSPAHPVSGNKIVMTFTRATALRLQAAVSQIVNGVTTAFVANGFEADIAGSLTAQIMAGPSHFWTESSAVTPEMIGVALSDPSPEASSGFSFGAIVRSARNTGQAAYLLNCDVWQGLPDAQPVSQPRALGPVFIAAAASQELKTAGGSNIDLPVAACTWPTVTRPIFIGNLIQFVWVDQNFAAGSLISVPIDVGVIGIFQVCGGMTAANSGRGARIAVRVA